MALILVSFRLNIPVIVERQKAGAVAEPSARSGQAQVAACMGYRLPAAAIRMMSVHHVYSKVLSLGVALKFENFFSEKVKRQDG